jgi:succinate dehydrogenase/fumarate reductase flavoprotein subunit
VSLDAQIDLLVLGAGIAGLTAAARTVAAGGRAIVVEKDSITGGSATFAEFLWTAPSVEVFASVEPETDLTLAERLVTGRAVALAWVRSLGVSCGPQVPLLGFGVGNRVDFAALVHALTLTVRNGPGSRVLVESEPVELIGDQRVLGAWITTADGELVEIRAGHTLLAMGGFAADASLRAKHIGESARELPLRAKRQSDGRSLRLSEPLQAGTRLAGCGFYGHLWPAEVTIVDPAQFAPMSMFHSEHGVLVNRQGDRFVDETLGDHINTLAVAEQKGGRALLITDERVHREWMLRPYVKGLEVIDRFANAYRAGGRCARADDLDELAWLPEEWGYPGESVRGTMQAFNAGCATGDLRPARSRDPQGLYEPPYYVVEVIPAITSTFGGLCVDREARVLNRGGAPIAGLLAAGADVGGLYIQRYGGGIAAGMAFGMAASETALSTPVLDAQ